jgi:hypothetical protein
MQCVQYCPRAIGMGLFVAVFELDEPPIHER